ncbi:secretion protein EspO [Escherichia coli]|nr:secretion protein EspO [Escherichia coli]
MPFSIKSIFSGHTWHQPEISRPIADKSSTKNCILDSTTCNVDGFTVFNRRSCSFDMRPPGSADRTPQLKLSISEVAWMSKIIETETNNTNKS